MSGSPQREATSVARAELLQALPLSLLSAAGVDDVLRLTARFVMDALGYEDCVIYLQTSDGHFEQRAAWGPKSPDGIRIINPMKLRSGEGIVGSAALQQAPQRIDDTATDTRYVPDVGSAGSELAVPIVYAGETLGVIDSEHPDRQFFNDSDAAVVSAIAAIVAGMLRSALSNEALRETIDELHATQRELELVAETDLLTGVGNRRHLEAAFADAAVHSDRFGVAVVDIDGLKRINDRYGTSEGDNVLRAVAAVLARACHSNGLRLARCESDEFVIVASPLPRGFAVRVAATLDEIGSLRVSGSGTSFEVTASAGIAYGTGLNTWTDATDALSLAKKGGGKTLWIYRPDDPGILSLRADRAWAQRIERVVADNTLRLACQAIRSVTDSSARFYEVLLRVGNPDGSWDAPTELLSAAERLGLEEVIDAWVTRHVVHAMTQVPADVSLAMNWSPASITSPEMVHLVLNELRVHDVDPARLVIEVTEHACIESPERFHEAVSHLRSSGISVAIDDLGSGWSSLRTLQSTPVDIIKLDGQWVCGTRRDELALIAIRSMIECATALDTLVIAEWVEDEATRALVEGLGVHFLQGWLVHRPEPLEHLFGTGTVPKTDAPLTGLPRG